MSRVTDSATGPGGSPTLDEVARLAGVSRATASRAINGHNRVSQKARDAVDAAVRTLGYAPNPAARSLVTRRTDSVALVVPDIISAVRSLRERGLEFMPTPGTYYEALPERLAKLGIAGIDEPIETLRELEILVDGHGPGRYLLQIFVKDSAALYKEAPAGPFFFELIQRKGDEGFGAGNFRALFESIERAQGGGA